MGRRADAETDEPASGDPGAASGGNRFPSVMRRGVDRIKIYARPAKTPRKPPRNRL
jgi:hypothetical protein